MECADANIPAQHDGSALADAYCSFVVSAISSE